MQKIKEIQELCLSKGYTFLCIKKDENNKQNYVFYTCKSHGNTRCRIDSFKKGTICKKCANDEHSKRTLWTTDIFKEKVNNLTGSEYKVLGRYVNANTKILLKHSRCNREFQMTPGHFIDGTRCPLCRGRYQTTESFSTVLLHLEGHNYTLVGEYINSITKIQLKHNECGNTYFVSPAKFKSGRRCPKCSSYKNSYLVQEIERVLEKYGLCYNTEYTFSNCTNKKPLRFDYAVFKANQLETLIEADGIQHFKSSKLFGGETGYSSTIENDQIKNLFCKTNNLSLLRISYKEIDMVETIILSHLNIKYTSTNGKTSNASDKQEKIIKRCLLVREMYLTQKYSILDLVACFGVSSTVIRSILLYTQNPFVLSDRKNDIAKIMILRSRKTKTGRKRSLK